MYYIFDLYIHLHCTYVKCNSSLLTEYRQNKVYLTLEYYSIIQCDGTFLMTCKCIYRSINSISNFLHEKINLFSSKPHTLTPHSSLSSLSFSFLFNMISVYIYYILFFVLLLSFFKNIFQHRIY